jgi:uncharacterized protein (TIGR00725 family)
MTRRPLIAVSGDGTVAPDSAHWAAAEELGKELVDGGYRVLTGGLGGVMEAACRGARQATNYHEGDTVALLPGHLASAANAYCDIVLPTGLDHARNVLVAHADALVAIGGGRARSRRSRSPGSTGGLSSPTVCPAGTGASRTPLWMTDDGSTTSPMTAYTASTRRRRSWPCSRRGSAPTSARRDGTRSPHVEEPSTDAAGPPGRPGATCNAA